MYFAIVHLWYSIVKTKIRTWKQTNKWLLLTGIKVLSAEHQAWSTSERSWVNDLAMLEIPSSVLSSHNVRPGRQRQLERVWCDCCADVTTDTLQHSSGRLTLWKDSISIGHFKVIHVSLARMRAVFKPFWARTLMYAINIALNGFI